MKAFWPKPPGSRRPQAKKPRAAAAAAASSTTADASSAEESSADEAEQGEASDAGGGDDAADPTLPEGEFRVSRIVDHRTGREGYEYLCVFAGYPESDKCWVKICDIDLGLVREYRREIFS